MPGHFRCVAADPPWAERGGGKIKRGADRHYSLMSNSDILRTMTVALEQLGGVHDDAHLWLWVTDNFLRHGLGIMDQLGFRYVRTLVWVKMKPHWKRPEGEPVLQVGLGKYLRGAHELCLFGTRGKAQLPATEFRHPSVVIAPRTTHSTKPDAAKEVIERVSPGPRVELFAREPRDGWTVWGNEV